MIQDSDDLPAGSVIEADLCIIGAGPVGLALAREFIGMPSLRVVVLESGALGVKPKQQRLNDGVENVGLNHLGNTSAGRARAFGGTGRLWAGQCLPLDDIDFEARPWVPYSGWPLSATMLAPYVARAEAFFHVEGSVYDERNYARFNLPPPSWSPDALRASFTVYTPRIDTGVAKLGEFRRATSIRVLLNAVVTDIETNSTATAVSGLRLLSSTGQVSQVRTRTVVLCAGGLENARLLLLSNAVQPSGLGNGRNLVGRFFQEHPNGITATLTSTDPTSADLQDRFRLLYGKGRLRYFPKFALSEATQRREQVLNCNAHLVFDYPETSAQPVLREVVNAMRQRRLPAIPLSRAMGLASAVGEVSSAVARRYLRGLSPRGKPTAVRLHCYLEQAPNPDSRVLLSPSARDVVNLPAMRVDWRMTELERRTLQVMTDTVSAEFARLGLGRMEATPWLHDLGADWQAHLSDCNHHIGTTRMAATPEMGVVGTDCGVYGVDGLYVGGSSVFPTSGYANPTLVMVALAIRLADELKRRLTTRKPSADMAV